MGVDHIDFQAGTLSSWIAISIIVTWRWTGYNALIYLASMQAIPFELYETAAIDGASRWRQFWSHHGSHAAADHHFHRHRVHNWRAATVRRAVAVQPEPDPHSGGSEHQFQTLALYTYDQFWQKFKYGYGAAISWAMFIVIILIVGINLILARRLRGVDAS